MDKISESLANDVRDAIIHDGSIGTDEWCSSHGFTRKDFLAFLDTGVLQAIGVDIPIKFISHTGKVSEGNCKWTVLIPRKYTETVNVTQESLEGSNDDMLVAHLTARQMPLPFDEPTLFDA